MTRTECIRHNAREIRKKVRGMSKSDRLNFYRRIAAGSLFLPLMILSEIAER